jgi:predicted nucleotidyltransferase
MDVIELLRKHEKEMKERFAVKRIGAFGSFVRGEQKETSDIDLVVEFENPTFDNFMDLAFYLEDLTGRSVDILTPEGIKHIRIKEVADEIRRSVVYV